MGYIQSGLLTRPSAEMPAYTRDNDLTPTLGGYWAYVMMPNNLELKIGSNFTFAGAGASVPVTNDNIVSVLIDACKQGLGYYIAEVDVKMPMPETAVESMVLAAYAAGLSTGITKFKYDLTMRHSNNQDFIDWLKTNPAMDFWFLTNTGYTYVDFAKTPLNYSGIGAEMNNIETTNAGTLKFSIQGKQTKATDGGIGVIPAPTEGSKGFPEFVLTMGALVNATDEGTDGQLIVLKRTSSASAVDIPLDVTPFNASFRLIDIDLSATAGRTKDYAGLQITYNDSAKKLVVASGGAGTLKIKVLANNTKGVKGEKSFKIIL